MKLLRSWLQDWIDLTDIDDTDLSTALESCLLYTSDAADDP